MLVSAAILLLLCRVSMYKKMQLKTIKQSYLKMGACYKDLKEQGFEKHFKSKATEKLFSLLLCPKFHCL